MKYTGKVSHRFLYSLSKEKTRIILCVILALFFIISIAEENNRVETRKTYSKLYSDRLSGENHLFFISHHLHEMEEIIMSPDYLPFHKQKLVAGHLHKLTGLNIAYSRIHRTQREKKVFENLQGKCNALYKYNLPGERLNLRMGIRQINETLILLSKTQIIENRENPEVLKIAKSTPSIFFILKLSLIIVSGLVVYKVMPNTSVPEKNRRKLRLIDRKWFSNISEN